MTPKNPNTTSKRAPRKQSAKLQAEALAAQVYMWCHADVVNEDGHPTQEMLDHRVSAAHRLCLYIAQL